MRWRGGEVLCREERTTKNGLEFRYDEVASWRNDVKIPVGKSSGEIQ